VSRPRKKDRHLPRRVYQSHGAFYFVDANGAWHKLCRIEDGEAALYDALAKIKAAPSGNSMPAAIATFKLSYLPSLAVSTRVEHGRMLDMISHDFKDYTVPQVEAPDIDRFLSNHYDADPEKGTPERRSMKRHAKARLSTFFRWCVRKGLRKTNPCREVWIDKSPPHKSKWTNATFYAIRDRLSPMLQCYLDMSFLIYQRTTEVRRLRLSQVREHECLIHFFPTKTAKSSGKDIDIPLTPDIAAVIARARSLAKVKAGPGGDAFVIQTTKGAPYTASGVRGAILLAAEQAGLAPPRKPGQKKPSAGGFTAKDLRAYAASTAKRQGYTLEQLKAGLAHTSITTTEGYVQQHTTPVSEVALRLPERPKRGEF